MRFLIVLMLFSLAASAQVNISPNMGLPIPIPGVTPGPSWASSIDASLLQIDSHNHSSGQGVQIQPNGININSELSFNTNNAVSLLTTRFTPQTSTITSASPNVGALYVVGNELYYNDVTGGNQVQITMNGTVNSGAGSISGLPSGTASASFAGGTFTWQSATNTAANMDAGSYIFRNSTPSSFGLTLQAPILSSNYSLTLPTIPGATSFMTMTSAGNMLTTIPIAAGITQSNLANNSVGTAQIIDANVTAAKLASSAKPTINNTDYSSSGSFVVPTGVNFILVEICSGGGGGAGGGGATGIGQGGGGGGGNGSLLIPAYSIPTTPGETLTVVVGTGGAGGAGGTSGGAGTNGTAGGSSYIQRSSTILLRTSGFDHSIGGQGGNTGAGQLGAPGGVTVNSVFIGGGYGGTAGGIASSAGDDTNLFAFTGGPGGSPGGGSGGGGGGGGGASSFGVGGGGGNGGNNTGTIPPTPGGVAGGACAGGGGGGGGAGATGAGSAGHAGNDGLVRISWTAPP